MPFNLLSRPIKRYIREKGWDCFRPIQEAAVEKIMTTQQHYILAARTASGKTEAAFLPVLSMLGDEPGIQALYISPLIALINDQLERVEDLCRYIDIEITRWHGDAGRDRKEKLLAQPAGILLITPESIESLFVNRPQRIHALFSSLRFIILDEIHSFLGTARGCQLQSLLSRIKAAAAHTPRFIALSATLGDYETARHFFGEGANTKILRDSSPQEAEVSFKYYHGAGKLLPAELILDLFRETLGKKSLIFPNSRGRVEEIAVKLEKAVERTGVTHRYFAHHSSVGKELREYAEHFAKHPQRSAFGIICTSTLELGIDIGQVDLVIQIDAAYSVSSLVQRFGRSGRKPGEKSRLLLYATNPWSLLQSLACIMLYREGFCEARAPLRFPVDILFQQILSILKETAGVTREELSDRIRKNFAFQAIPQQDVERLIRFMIAEEYIESIDRQLIIGFNAEKIVDSRSFYSVFKVENNYKVFFQQKTIGELTSSANFQVDQNIYLAARMWKIIDIDNRRMEIYVKEAADGKRPVFNGAGGDIQAPVREKMLEILVSDTPLTDCDETARAIIADLRRQFAMKDSPTPPDISSAIREKPVQGKNPDNGNNPVHGVLARPVLLYGDRCEFFTFTGTKIDKTMQQLFIARFGSDFSYNEARGSFRIPITYAEFTHLTRQLKELLSDFEAIIDKALKRRESVFDFGKWGRCLPGEFKKKMLLLDYFDIPGTKKYLDALVVFPAGADES